MPEFGRLSVSTVALLPKVAGATSEPMAFANVMVQTKLPPRLI
jgi:hypothetical protein